MNALSEVSDEVSQLFRDLGYGVTWDFSKRDGLHWYEIYDGGKQIAQIDFGVPLACLLEDIPCFAAGDNGKSSHTYEVRGSSENFAAIYKRIRDRSSVAS